MKNSYTIHDLPSTERPRERLREVGVDNLSLQELLALVIERGRPGLNVLTIAQNLLAEFGNLKKAKQASLEELQKVKGIGFATACKIKASFKLGEKAQVDHNKYGQKIESPEDIFNLLKNKIGDKKREHFIVISLDSRSCLIGLDKISIGTLDASLAHPREIFQSAIRNSAASIILAHNHPSKNCKPSKKDIGITKKIMKASRVLDIKMVDHVVITHNDYFSFKKMKMIIKNE